MNNSFIAPVLSPAGPCVVAAICCLAGVVASCSTFETRSCNEIGCSDELSLSLRTADGRWADGQYDLTIEGDVGSGPVVCGFRMPDNAPVGGSSTALDCTGSLSLSLGQDSKCTQPPQNSRISEPCVPLAGQFVLAGVIDGMPKELKISLTRDGVPIVSRTVKPTYERMQPNGPDCEPICHVAEETITASRESD